MPSHGQARGEGDGVLLGDADVEEALGQRLLQLVERGALGHRGGDADDRRVALRQLDQRVAEDILILRRLARLLLHLAGDGIIGAGAVELGRLGLGEVAAAALLRDDLDEDRAVASRLAPAEDLDHLLGVVAVEGAEEGEAQLLEDDAGPAGQHELFGAAHACARRPLWPARRRARASASCWPVSRSGGSACRFAACRGRRASAPTLSEMLLSLSLRTTMRSLLHRARVVDRLERHAAGQRAVADDGDDAVIFSPFRSRAAAMPSAAEMEVLAWLAPKASYSLSSRRR